MDKAMNTLPIQTYVRSRVSTVVLDVAGQSSGSAQLDLAKASDVTFIIATDTYCGQPMYFVAAIDRQPTLSDLDLILSPPDPMYCRNQDNLVLRLPAGPVEIYWKGLSMAGELAPFPADFARLILAIDQ